MWIKQLEVVSFGKWHQKTIDLTSGFNYLYGNNESGKSSLRSFITYILFGLSASEREQYTSLLDGQLGGRLILTDGVDEYTIERFSHRNRGKRVGYLAGEVVQDKEVERLLDHVDHYIYQAIFSFQDRDLEAIRHQQSDDIGKVLFNLGLTGSEDIVEIEQGLTKESDKLFKKQGRKPPINQALQQLKAINEEIEKAQIKEQEHATLYQEAKQLELDIQALKDEDEQLNQQIKDNQQLLQVSSSIDRVQLLDQEMASLLNHSHLSQDVIDRYEDVKAKRQTYDDRARAIMAKMSEAKEERNRLMAQSKKAHFPFTLDEIQAWTVEWEYKKQQYDDLSSQIQSKRAQLQKLNLPVDESELRSLSVSDYTKQTWSRIAYDLHANAEKLSDLERRKRIKLDELRSLESKQQDNQKRLLTEEERATNSRKLEHVNQQIFIGQTGASRGSSSRNRQTSLKQTSFMVGKWLALALAIGFVLTGVMGWMNVFSYMYAGISGVAVYVLHIRLQRSNDQQVSHSGNSEEEVYLEQEKSEIERIIANDDQLINDNRDLQTKIDYVNSELREVESGRLSIEEIIDDLEFKQNQEINQHPWLERYELEQWEDIAQQLINAKHILSDIDQLVESQRTTESSLDYIKEQMQRFLSYYVNDLNWRDDQAGLSLVREYLNQERDITNQIDQHHHWLEELEKQLQELKDEYAPYEQAMEDMLSEIDVENESELEDVIQAFATYQEKDQKRTEAYKAVKQLFGDSTEEVIAQSYNWDHLQEVLQNNRHRKETGEAQLEEKRQRLADCTAHIRQIEEDGRLSDLIHERSKIEDEIKTLSKQWAALKVAKGLIQDTKSKYQYDYLPHVLTQTSQLFNKLTQGIYQTVRFSQEESLMVQRYDDVWFDVRQLSDGTADQLYVALRFALNESLRDTKAFPFILDDAFVHFDHERKQEMMRILSQQAKKQQIIYFSFEEGPSSTPYHVIHLN
ncbi:AAA family ATPase [Alkalibacillus almallahensis]|uniref:AAA family ATPase n=1 Tax=Alkalibacillus almallahensis TaxID=1379154 RepID=UPI001424339D|nr:uncharacterized protein YhaN [Alkalibacillus almallahensis]